MRKVPPANPGAVGAADSSRPTVRSGVLGGDTVPLTMIRRHRWVAVVAAGVIVTMTAVLAVLAAQVNARAERDLLQRQVAQAGAVLITQVAVVTTQLADAGPLATATDADPGMSGASLPPVA
jgi:hypothetical protein